MSYVGKVEAGEEENLVGTTLFGVCSTPAATAAKVVTIPGLDTVFTGLSVHVQFTNSNGAEQPTLQFQGSGLEAKPIFRHGNIRPGTTAADSWFAGAVLELTYDGSGWQITGWLNTDTNTTYQDAQPGTSGLMPGADKTRFDSIGILTYQDVSVPVSAWSNDSPYPEYPYKVEIPVGDQANKVDFSGYMPTVIFSLAQISTYGPAPIAVSGLGKVTVYTLAIEETSAIVIPTVQMTRGG